MLKLDGFLVKDDLRTGYRPVGMRACTCVRECWLALAVFSQSSSSGGRVRFR